MENETNILSKNHTTDNGENPQGNRGRKPGTQKTGGRQKGTPNKITKSVREKLEKIVSWNMRTIQRDLDNIADPKDRLMILEKFMAYIVPKQSAVKAEINNLSPDDVQTVTDSLLKSLTDEQNN